MRNFNLILSDTPKQGTKEPEVFDEDYSESSIFSKPKRGYNIINELYHEELEKNRDLAQLLTEISVLKESKVEKKDAINNYIRQNSTYYREAEVESGLINNKKIRNLVTKLIKASMGKYDREVAEINSLKGLIDSLDTTIDDYQHALKIVYTIPYIEHFQISEKEKIIKADRILNGYRESIKKSERLFNEPLAN